MLYDYNGLEIFFLVCAGTGTALVLIKLVLQLLGADQDTDVGFDNDVDVGHPGSDEGFRVLSLHGFSSFFMMFGLVGLALYRQSQMGVPLSIAGALVAGMASVWIIGKLFQGAVRLQSSGTLKISEAVGCKGTVYLTIPAGGIGRVSINFHNRLREFDAIEKAGAQLVTGTPVQVVEIKANILVVETIQ
jgi:membrane protein implicated in regulation of membrane protease activity